MRPLFFHLLAAVLLLTLAAGCSRPPEGPAGTKASDNRPSRNAGVRNLVVDEQQGGHTLKRHVGRSDRELRARLRRERGISAASTYTDRHMAEEFIGECLSDNDGRIGQWMERERHPNLVLDCVGDPAWPIGRTLRRGQKESEPCSDAAVVLKWKPPHQYYVLTSYPNCQ